MQDIMLEQDNSSQLDFVVDEANKVIDTIDGMETAVSFQLFTDKRVSREERANPLDRRGWIGDLETRGQGYQVGSLLHTKEQCRDTQADRNELAALSRDALNYFIALGASKDVTARIVGNNVEGTIVNDSNDISRYAKLWRGTVGNG